MEEAKPSRSRPVPESKKFEVWNDSLSRFSWRVDLKSSSRSVSEINQPTAIIEIETTSENDTKNVVHFEMNAEQMAFALMQMEAIQKSIDNSSQ